MKSTEKELESFITSKQKIIYHYTNIPALFNGILSENDICLWATNAQYMNDPQEICFGHKLVSYTILDKESDNEFEKTKNEFIKNSFITSFSYKNDFLPMWSMYGENGAGISLGFNSELLTNANQILLNCVYFSKTNHDEIVEYLMKVEEPMLSSIFNLKKIKTQNLPKKEKFEILKNSSHDLLFYVLYNIVTIVAAKNSAYSYEEEVRLMNLNPTNIKFRKQENIIVPYIEQHFPKDALQEIIIGPTNNMEQSESSLRTYLDNLGYKHVTIKRSEVPYRAKVC